MTSEQVAIHEGLALGKRCTRICVCHWPQNMVSQRGYTRA